MRSRTLSLFAFVLLLVAGCADLGVSTSGGKVGLGPGGIDVQKPKVTLSITGTGHVNTTLLAYDDISRSMGGVFLQAGYVDVGATIRAAILKTEPNADVVFAIDTTGSMALALPDVKTEVEAALRALSASQPDRRFGIVAYRDQGDTDTFVVRNASVLGAPVEATISQLRALDASGGGDFPEHVWAGLDAALRQPWRTGVPRHVIIVGDAPPHDDYSTDPRNRANETALARQLGARVSAVAITCSVVCKREIGL